MQLLCGEINIFFADIPQSLRRENGKKKIKVLKNGCKFAHLWWFERSIAIYRLQFGMPPSDFVRWRRRSKIGVGCIYLFNHRQDYFKTVDKKVYYVGQGVLGRGYIRQGLLADRFLLNGLAAMTCRPELLMNCFATTKQEDYGRFSVRFFEGSGWRTVYIGDWLSDVHSSALVAQYLYFFKFVF